MTAQLTDLEAQLQILRNMYEQKIPFNRLLGFRVETVKTGFVAVRFDMQDDLIGNWVYGILHGGVISSVLDAASGLMATAGMIQKKINYSIKEISENIARVGTIDLRVDYLRPGRGEYFRATGTIMRAGNKVAVARMELYNQKDLLIAVGTGTYIVG